MNDIGSECISFQIAEHNFLDFTFLQVLLLLFGLDPTDILFHMFIQLRDHSTKNIYVWSEFFIIYVFIKCRIPTYFACI